MAVALALATAVVAAAVYLVVGTGPPGLEARWRLRAGGAVVGAPEVQGGTLFVATRAGALVAVEAETGAARWRFETGERVQAPPVAQGGLVYVVTDASESGGGRVFAVDARTGTEQWRVALDVPVTSRLSVDGGLVYVPAGDVVAVDALTGEERWRATVGTGTVALSAGSGVVVVTGPSGLGALDADTGGERWRASTPGPSPVAPVVAGDSVVAGDGAGFLVGRDTVDGTERWRVPDAGLAQPPLAEGQVLVLATPDGLMALAGATGERLWRVGLGGGDDDDRVRVATDGTAVAATSGGRLTLFDAVTGEVLGAADLADEGRATPAVANGRVYVAEGEIIAAFDRPGA